MISQSPYSRPPSFIVHHDNIKCGMAFGHFGEADLVLSPHSFFCASSVFTDRATWEAGESLILCRCCSATIKISVSYLHYYSKKNPKHSTVSATMKTINSISTKTRIQFPFSLMLPVSPSNTWKTLTYLINAWSITSLICHFSITFLWSFTSLYVSNILI